MTLIKKKYQLDLAHRIKMEEEEHAEWGGLPVIGIYIT